MNKLLSIFLIFFLFSCDQNDKVTISQSEILQEARRLKEREEINLKELKRFNRLDSLSEYEFSGMKKFVDSIKVNDSLKYFALKRVMERDTINNYMYLRF